MKLTLIPAVSLAMMVCTSAGFSASAEDEADFWTGKWTATAQETVTLPDGTVNERESSDPGFCLDTTNNTVAAIEATFLKSYMDRQCTLAEVNFEAATDTVSVMTGSMSCGPASGALTLKYAPVLVNVSSLLSIDTGDGDMTVHTRTRWVRNSEPC